MIRILVAALLIVLAAPVAAAVAASSTFTGTVTAGGTAFVTHKIDVGSAGTISATLDWSDGAANLNLQLNDPSGTRVAFAGSTTAKPETIVFEADRGGTWKLGVKAARGSSPYTLAVTFPGKTAPTFARQIPGGGTGAGHAEVYPSGLDVDDNGNIYVADTGNDMVKAYDANGNHMWTTGSRGSKAIGRFNNPRDVAYLDGKVYVDDVGYNRVQVLDAATGMPLSQWSYRFPSTLGISAGVNAAGQDRILVALDTLHQILVFDPADGSAPVQTLGGAGLLNGPRDADTDAQGNVYIADYANNRIVKMDPSGAVVQKWGKTTTPTASARDGEFNHPYGVDVGDDGYVYIADSDNNRIQKLTTDGQFVAKFGSQAPIGSAGGPGEFQQLRRVAVGPGLLPEVFGADLWNMKIIEFSQPLVGDTGVFVKNIAFTLPEDGFFNEPSGVTVTPAGRLYVADAVNQRMQYLDAASGQFLGKWGQRGWGNQEKDGFNWPRDIAWNEATGTMWVADTKNNRLVEFGADGGLPQRKIGVLGATPGKFNWPYAVEALPGGDLIVADTNNHRVQRVTPAGAVVWAAAGMNFPKDVAIDGNRIYVADSKNKAVVVLDADTGAAIAPGSFGTTQLHSPEGLAVDPATGDVWVADTSFNRLVQYTSAGTFVQAVGSFGAGPGKFNRPTHLWVHGGQIYVADTWNDRIQILNIG